MHLPVTTAIAASGALLAARYDTSSYKASDAPSISGPVLVMRQDASTSGPHTAMISTILTTSVVSITSQPTSSTKVSTSDAKTVTSSSLPPAPTVTATTHPGTSSASMTTITSQAATSIATTPMTTKSTPGSSAPATSAQATSTAVESVSTTSTATTSTVATPAAAASATQSTEPTSGPTPWATKGKIAGIVVGSVFGLVLLGLLGYALFAASRGINVCNCCGGCFDKREDDEEIGRLPSRSSDTYPYPGGNNPGPGTGYYRPARPIVLSAIPLTLPQQVEDERRAGKLQRKRG